MKITAVKAVYPKWKHVGAPGRWQRHFWQIVVQIESDSGVIGVGMGGGGLPAVEIVNRHFRDLLVGREVTSIPDIEDIWEDLYLASIPYGRKGMAVMALSGVDLALWDLLSKAQDVPVYELIGKKTKNKVRVYASGSDIYWYKDLGITANKLSSFNIVRRDSMHDGKMSGYEHMYEAVSRSRQILGDNALIMIDCYMTWDTLTAIDMAHKLADLNIYWFEDLLTPDCLKELAFLRAEIKPILSAGGEHEFTHYGFEEIARLGALDVWQPDVTWCGGITAGLRIVDLAGRYGVPVVPHRGGEVWGLHLIVATDCQDLAECNIQNKNDPNDFLWSDAPLIDDGFIAPRERPGFGVDLNDAML